MWPQRSINNKTNNITSDQSNKFPENNSENWINNKKEISNTDCSLYDSGRTDSGFLSGANIVSEEIQISSSSPIDGGEEESDLTTASTTAATTTTSSSSSTSSTTTALNEQTSSSSATAVGGGNVSYVRLDSGVDVGLSDQLSELSIDETGVNIKKREIDEKLCRQQQQNEDEMKKGEIPWHNYFKQDEDGDTQLHIAIIQGCIEVVFNLIRMVPSSKFLDIRNYNRQTALHLAVLTSQPRILRRLVCAGACTKSVDTNGNTALHLAVAAKDFQCVKALTEPITQLDITTSQLRYRPNQRQPQPPELDMYNYDGLTCVHVSAMRRDIPILRHLSNIGANIDARECKSGRTALHMAAELRDTELGSLLLREFRANPHILDYSGKTPYYLARNDRTFIKVLLSSGASYETDFSSDSDYDSDSDSELMVQMNEGFRDFHTNGIVNATA